MSLKKSYDAWSKKYDTNINKTRDLEGHALKATLANIHFDSCLEIGCGTGKNTEWLITKAKHITGVDLSPEMLALAKEKITSDAVRFKQADITASWDFREQLYDLVTFSLVLEHIENLDHIFSEVSKSLEPGGHVYVGEFHPFKQYTGSKARFEADDETHVLEAYTHHVSEFVNEAKKYDLQMVDVNEYFDDDDRTGIPRVLVLVFMKR